MRIPQRYEDLFLFATARTLAALLARLPPGLAVRIGRTLGATWYRLGRRDARIAATQLRTILHLESDREARKMARAVFERMGEEVVALLQWPGQDPALETRVVIDGRQHLDAALAPGRGAVFLTGHVGNWELMAMKLARHYPLYAIVNEMRYPRLNRLVTDFRAQNGVQSLVRGRETSRSHLEHHLSRGRIVGILVDQHSHTRGAMLPFLGKPAHTPIVPAMLALETGAALVAGFMERESVRRYRVRILPPVVAPAAGGSLVERACALMARVNELLGAAILADPVAWPWFHRRWAASTTERAWHA